MRAFIYTRISKDRAGAGVKVATQEADCRELAAKLGADVVAVFTDNDLSAYSGKPRPAYAEMLDRIIAGEVDVVLAWHTDRLHRSPTELEKFIDGCDRHHVSTHTVTAGPVDLSTPSGRLVARQLGAVARYEVEHSIVRQKRAKARAAAEGTWKGGRRPFGFEADGVTVNQVEADAIVDATASVLAGDPVAGIARDWNERKILTTTGKQWRPDGPRRILLRPRNAGLMEHQGEVIGNAEWPALVDPVQWRAVVRVLSNPTRRTNQTNSAVKWLGSGLYRCHACNGPVRVGTTKGIPTYRCREASHVSRAQEPVDDYVSRTMVHYLRTGDRADLLWTPPGSDIPALEAEAETLTQRKAELSAMFATGQIDKPQLTVGTEIIDKRLEEIRVATAAEWSGTALQDVATAADPGAAWLALPVARQRAVLDTVLEVTLMPSPRGRPAGWVQGPYFRANTVRLDWKN